jgi:hypothetical protein
MYSASFVDYEISMRFSSYLGENRPAQFHPLEGKSYTLPEGYAAAATAAAFAGPRVEASRGPRFWSTWIAVSAFALSEHGM